jgi:nitrogen fixation protein FixH
MNKDNRWPFSITLFYSLFVAAFIIFMFFSFDNNYQMVTENYYQKSLNYEEQITRIKNTNALETKPLFNPSRTTNEIFLIMPEIFNNKNVKGKIIFFRPSDSNLDQTISLKLNENNIQIIPVTGIVTGKWQAQLFWSDGKTDYYYEQVLVL